jgi:hypothetical protein
MVEWVKKLLCNEQHGHPEPLGQNQENDDGQKKNLEHSNRSLKLEVYILDLNQKKHNNFDLHHHHI